MRIRLAGPEDAAQIAAIFYNTIRRVNSADYSSEQIEAWAPKLRGADEWSTRMASNTTVVADDNSTIAGFAELEDDGQRRRSYETSFN